MSDFIQEISKPTEAARQCEIIAEGLRQMDDIPVLKPIYVNDPALIEALEELYNAVPAYMEKDQELVNALIKAYRAIEKAKS